MLLNDHRSSLVSYSHPAIQICPNVIQHVHIRLWLCLLGSHSACHAQFPEPCTYQGYPGTLSPWDSISISDIHHLLDLLKVAQPLCPLVFSSFPIKLQRTMALYNAFLSLMQKLPFFFPFHLQPSHFVFFSTQ